MARNTNNLVNQRALETDSWIIDPQIPNLTSQRHTLGPPSKTRHLCQWVVTTLVITLYPSVRLSFFLSLSRFIFHATQCNCISLPQNLEKATFDTDASAPQTFCGRHDIRRLQEWTTRWVLPPHAAAGSAKPILRDFRDVATLTTKVHRLQMKPSSADGSPFTCRDYRALMQIFPYLSKLMKVFLLYFFYHPRPLNWRTFVISAPAINDA